MRRSKRPQRCSALWERESGVKPKPKRRLPQRRAGLVESLSTVAANSPRRIRAVPGDGGRYRVRVRRTKELADRRSAARFVDAVHRKQRQHGGARPIAHGLGGVIHGRAGLPAVRSKVPRGPAERAWHHRCPRRVVRSTRWFEDNARPREVMPKRRSDPPKKAAAGLTRRATPRTRAETTQKSRNPLPDCELESPAPRRKSTMLVQGGTLTQSLLGLSATRSPLRSSGWSRLADTDRATGRERVNCRRETGVRSLLAPVYLAACRACWG